MPIIFNIDEAVKRTEFGILEDPIKLAFANKSEPFEQKSLIGQYFIVRKTAKFEERFRSEGRTMGEFELSDDMEVAPIDDNGEGFAKSFGVVTWQKGFVVSQQVIEDGDLREIRKLSDELVTGFYRGREYYARNMISGGLSGKYAYTRKDGGAVHNFDCTTLDSVDGALSTVLKCPLFCVAHRLPENHLKTAAGNSVVQFNKFSAIGGIDPTELLATEKIKDFLGQVRAKGKAQLGEDGKTAGYTYDTIIVPSHYRLQNAIAAAIQGDSTWNLVVDEYLDGHTGFAAADLGFLVKSSAGLSETEGAILLDRIPLTIRSYIENKNQANVWSGRARYGAGFVSYRHIAYCTFINTALVTTSAGTFTVNGSTVSDIATISDRDGVILKGNALAVAAANAATVLELNSCFYGLTLVAHAKAVEVANTVASPVHTLENS